MAGRELASMLSTSKSKSDDAVLIIRIIRTGGFAGVEKRWAVELTDPAQAAEWRSLVKACPWDEESRVLPEPDRFVYRIVAATPKRERTAVVPEQHLTGPWRELVDRVRKTNRPGKVAGSRGSGH
jgi:hypothetical protein